MKLEDMLSSVKEFLNAKNIEADAYLQLHDEKKKKVGNVIPIEKGAPPSVGSLITKNEAETAGLYLVVNDYNMLIKNRIVQILNAVRIEEQPYRFFISFPKDGGIDLRGFNTDILPEIGEIIVCDNSHYRVAARSHALIDGRLATFFRTEENKPKEVGETEQTSSANHRPFGTSGMAPADSAPRAGAMPEASGDS